MSALSLTHETPVDIIRQHAHQLGLDLTSQHASNLLRSIPDLERATRFVTRAAGGTA